MMKSPDDFPKIKKGTTLLYEEITEYRNIRVVVLVLNAPREADRHYLDFEVLHDGKIERWILDGGTDAFVTILEE